MTHPTIENDAKLSEEQSNLKELSRHTPHLESRYFSARAEFLAASRALAWHGERFDSRAAKVENLGGSYDFRHPIEPEAVTADELKEPGDR